MSDDLDKRIEAAAQQLSQNGVPIERARAIIRKAVYAPPTSEEIKHALQTIVRKSN